MNMSLPEEQKVKLHTRSLYYQLRYILEILVEERIITFFELSNLLMDISEASQLAKDRFRTIRYKIKSALSNSDNDFQDRLNPWSGRENALNDPYLQAIHEIINESMNIFKVNPQLRKMRWLIEQINKY
jgi:hypothetical protein